MQQQQQFLDDANGSLLLAGASVEDRLRAAVKYKNIRIREFFRDFDPLRKGIITGQKTCYIHKRIDILLQSTNSSVV